MKSQVHVYETGDLFPRVRIKDAQSFMPALPPTAPAAPYATIEELWTVTELRATKTGNDARPGTVRVFRHQSSVRDIELLHFLVRRGAIWVYKFPPGSDILLAEGHALLVTIDFNGEVVVAGREHNTGISNACIFNVANTHGALNIARHDAVPNRPWVPVSLTKVLPP